MTARRLVREYDEAFKLCAMVNLGDTDEFSKEMSFTMLAVAYDAMITPPLTSPRIRYTQADLSMRVTVWENMRKRSSNKVFFKYLGVPHFLFEQLGQVING